MKVVTDMFYTPERAHFDDAGLDFRTPEGFILKPGESKVLDLGVKVEIPVGYFGKMESKSGLMVNHGIICMGGVIDSGYRGTIKIRLINLGDEEYIFHENDKVVQMVVIPCLLCKPEKAYSIEKSESGRDESGFGSSGR